MKSEIVSCLFPRAYNKWEINRKRSETVDNFQKRYTYYINILTVNDNAMISLSRETEGRSKVSKIEKGNRLNPLQLTN